MPYAQDPERVRRHRVERVYNVGKEPHGVEREPGVHSDDLGRVRWEAGGAAGLEEGVRGGHDAREEAEGGRRDGLGVLGDEGLARHCQEGDNVEAPIVGVVLAYGELGPSRGCQQRGAKGRSVASRTQGILFEIQGRRPGDVSVEKGVCYVDGALQGTDFPRWWLAKHQENDSRGRGDGRRYDA